MIKVFALMILPQVAFAVEPIKYADFMQSYFSSSLIIKIKNKELDAITEKNSSINYYFIPKLTISGQNKLGGNRAENFEINTTLKSTLYDAQLYNEIDKHEIDYHIAKYKLQEAIDSDVLNLNENLASIFFINELDSISKEFEFEETAFIVKMENKVKYGLVEQRELEQAYLLRDRVNSERKIINSQISQFKNNIELITGEIYPSQGISVDKNWVEHLFIYSNSESESINDNLQLKIINLEINSSLLQIKQADPKLSLSLEAMQKYSNDGFNSNVKDNYIGVNITFNPFDFTQVSEASSKAKIYEANILRKESIYKDLASNVSKLELEYASDSQELKDLIHEDAVTKKIIDAYERDYQLGGVSFFELSKTKYDLFSLQKRIITLKIKMLSNRLKLAKLYNNRDIYNITIK